MKLNLYETLGITEMASNQEIKKAYVQKIREHPAENEPEKFRQIRYAYETLSNEKLKAEYNALTTYGEEIEWLYDIGKAAMDRGDFDQACKSYKKILIIEPSMQTARNYYALCLTYSEDYLKAFRQYEKLIKHDPENALYFFNYGFALVNAGDFTKGMNKLMEALKLDPHDINTLFSIVDCYVNQHQYEDARLIIEQELHNEIHQSNVQMVYLFKLLEVNIICEFHSEINSTIKRIDNWIISNPSEINSITRELSLLALKLAKAKRFNLAKKIIEKAIEKEPENETIQNIYKDIASNAPIYEEMEALKQDDRVSESIKSILMIYVYGDEVNDEEFEEYHKQFFENLKISCMYDSDNAIKSIKYILIHYPNLYDIRKKVFQKSMKLAKEYKEIHRQYEVFREDRLITNGVKRLIALYLTEFSEEERSEYFVDIMDEIGDQSNDSIHRSVLRLKTHYSALYQLNSDFMENLLKISSS